MKQNISWKPLCFLFMFFGLGMGNAIARALTVSFSNPTAAGLTVFFFCVMLAGAGALSANLLIEKGINKLKISLFLKTTTAWIVGIAGLFIYVLTIGYTSSLHTNTSEANDKVQIRPVGQYETLEEIYARKRQERGLPPLDESLSDGTSTLEKSPSTLKMSKYVLFDVVAFVVFILLFILIFRSLMAFFAEDESNNESKESTDVADRKEEGAVESPFTMAFKETLKHTKKAGKESHKLGERVLGNETLIYNTLFGTEAKAKRSLIVIACLLFFFIFIYVPWQTSDEPKNYDDCILKNIKASQTGGAVYAIKRACRNKFPEK